MNTQPQPPAKDPKAFSFSDLLPASLVRDLRQSYRSPLYILLVLVSLALIYTSNFDDDFRIDHLLIGSTLVIGILVPMRVGQNVSFDLRDRGTNFLKISPLTAAKIIWGQFLSATLQIFVFTLLLFPLYWQFGKTLMIDMPLSTFTVMGYEMASWQIIYYLSALNFLVVLFVVALQLVLAVLPAFCRLGASVVILMSLLSLSSLVIECPYKAVPQLGGVLLRQYSIDMRALTDSYWLLWGFVYAIPCLLMLARRHYASGNEVGSAFIRVWGLLFLIGTAALMHFTLGLKESLIFISIPVALITIISMIDELLPRKVVIGTTKLRKNSICLLSRISPFSNWLYLMIVLLTTTLCVLGIIKLSGEQYTQHLLWSALAWPLGFIYTAYASLFFTDIISAYTSRNRIVIYGVCTIVISIVGAIVGAGSRIFPIHCLNTHDSFSSNSEMGVNEITLPEHVISILYMSLFCFIGVYLVRLIRRKLNIN